MASARAARSIASTARSIAKHTCCRIKKPGMEMLRPGLFCGDTVSFLVLMRHEAARPRGRGALLRARASVVIAISEVPDAFFALSCAPARVSLGPYRALRRALPTCVCRPAVLPHADRLQACGKSWAELPDRLS